MAETQVYRAPLRSRRDDVDPLLAFERATGLGVCGLGGRLVPPPRDLHDALDRTATEYDERTARRLERFIHVPDGAHVWTREPGGGFVRGVLRGPWRYDSSAGAHEADLVHVRDCAWDNDVLGEHEVPTPVAATFRRGGRNFQRIRAAS